MRWMTLLVLVMFLTLGAGGACAEEWTEATIDLVFDGVTYTDTVHVDWTEKYPVPEGGVKWDGTKEFVAYPKCSRKDISVTDEGFHYVDGQIAFAAKLGTDFNKVEQLAAKNNAIIVGYIALTENYLIEVVGDRSTHQLKELIEKLKRETIIEEESVILNYAYLMESNGNSYPNDPWFKRPEEPMGEWITREELVNADDNKRWSVIAINAPKAWRYPMDSINIGVIDTSFPPEHEDIRFAAILDIDEENDGHGVHVAGIAAAQHDNGLGISGVHPNASVVAVGIGDGNSDAFWVTGFSWIGAITQCINRDAKIINISQGRDQESAETRKGVWGWLVKQNTNSAYSSYFDHLEKMGGEVADFLIVCGAGNHDEDTVYYQQLLDVDSQFLKDRLVVVSSITWRNGPQFYQGHCWGKSVDILAPGYNVYSCIAPYVAETEEEIKYGNMLGTSQASPHVTGVAAMIKSIDPSKTGPEIKEILLRNGTKIQDNHGNEPPVLDAYACVQDVLGIGTATGQVKADDDHGLQAMVEVTQNGKFFATIETDENGCFSTDLPIGQYELSVRKDGYMSIERKIVVSPGNDVIEEFSLRSDSIDVPEITKGMLKGRVIFNSEGVSNIEVNVLKGTTPVITLITANGYFDVDLEPGTYTLSIDADGYVPTSRDITVFTGKTTTENIVLDDSMYAVATQTMNATIQYDVKLFNAHGSITQFDMKVTLRNGTVLMDTANGIRSGVTMQADGFTFQIDDELAQGAQLEVTATDGQRRTYSGAIVLSSGLWSGAKKLPDSCSNGGYWDANGFYHESDY